MTERPRDKNGRFIAYAECKKKKCIEMRKKNTALIQQVNSLNKKLDKSEQKLITPMGIFFGFLALFAIITLIFQSVSE